MIRILKKDLNTFFLFTLIVMGPSFILWSINKSDRAFPVAVFVQLAFSYLITIMTVMLNEQNEDINNGYRLYKILPVRNRDVMLIKFLVPVLSVVILGLINRGIYSLFPVGTDILAIADSLTVIFSVLFLLNSGFIIIGVSLLGYTRFIQFTSALIVVIVFGSLLLSKLFAYNQETLGRTAHLIENWLIHGEHLLFLIIGVVMYIGMGLLSTTLEKK